MKTKIDRSGHTNNYPKKTARYRAVFFDLLSFTEKLKGDGRLEVVI
jgi:hypothetical protein